MKRVDTRWDAWRYSSVLDSWERATISPPGEPVNSPYVSRISLECEDEVEFPFYVWDSVSERDAAIALQTHALIECEYEEHNATVLVRDWWSKQTIGKLVCRDEIDDLAI